MAEANYTSGDDYVVEFLQNAHAADERYTVRDGINVARYALKTLKAEGGGDTRAALDASVVRVLGEDALRHRPGE